MLRKQSMAALMSGGVLAGALALAAPAQAEPVEDAFLGALTEAGVGAADPAARVADVGGMSLGPATMFTGIAISMFCPAAVSSIGGGELPIPLSILGF